jgi:hypothetical protein
MSAAKLKGSLLEYEVRRLLLNCGFTKVRPDGLMIYNSSGLTMINGKGAAHDADVLMNPPIQMPFSYPSRINFECKAYNRNIGLTIIRNALGLRYDINNFEVVTRGHLRQRQNPRRRNYAIEYRQRYNYQVGVASVEDFSKPAFEFAANNKIPLISLRWFLPDNICDQFHLITDDYLRRFSNQQLDDLLQFLKGNRNREGERFIMNEDSVFRNIYNSVEEFENRVLIGLLETGDMLFLISENGRADREILYRNNHILHAQFHYYRRELDYWTLTINQQANFGFYLPKSIIDIWARQGFDRRAAINIKEEMFAKVFIFIRNGELPFRILNIDREWLNGIYDNQ